MTKECKNKSAGFTLLEVVLVTAIMVILCGITAPLMGHMRTAQKTVKVAKELKDIVIAMEWHHHDGNGYPNPLTDSTFFGPYLAKGIDNDTVSDDFDPGSEYIYAGSPVSMPPQEKTITSVGPNGTDDSETGDDIWVACEPDRLALRRTRYRIEIIGAALANFFWDSDRTTEYYHLVGTWTGAGNDRNDAKLRTIFDEDGWGTDFVSQVSDPDDAGFSAVEPIFYSHGPDVMDDNGSDDDISF